jgi:hypothetical protein
VVAVSAGAFDDRPNRSSSSVDHLGIAEEDEPVIGGAEARVQLEGELAVRREARRSGSDPAAITARPMNSRSAEFKAACETPHRQRGPHPL